MYDKSLLDRHEVKRMKRAKIGKKLIRRAGQFFFIKLPVGKRLG
jgi:hypothetical protein